MKAGFCLSVLLLFSPCGSETANDTASGRSVANAPPSASGSQDPDGLATLGGDLAAQKHNRAAACHADENPIFACRFADGKQVAVCGTPARTAQYRFGGDTPELVLGGGQRAQTMYSGGGEAQIAFDNGDTRYIVFSRMVRTGFDERGNNPAISDGVVVERAGKFAAIRICDDPNVVPVEHSAAEIHLPAAELPDDRFLFTEETFRADPFTSE